MALHLYCSDQLGNLVLALASQLKNNTQNPLQKNTIVVQSPGMARWLWLTLAKENQVAANLEFPMVASFLWELMAANVEGVKTQTRFGKQPLSWSLWEQLEVWIELPEFEVLKAYVEAGDQPALRRFRLSQQLADLFDQYLLYRPDWIDAWQQDQMPVDIRNDAHSEWQSALWRKLVKHSQQEDSLQLDHRVWLQQAFMKRLEQGEQLKVPANVYIFGISVMPDSHLQLVNALAKHSQVEIFQLSPSSEYWLEDKTKKSMLKESMQLPLLEESKLDLSPPLLGNELLNRWGAATRPYLAKLYELVAYDFVDMHSNSEGSFESNNSVSLLHYLQHNILNAKTADPWLLKACDNSFTIHSCYSVIREVEALHDYLLTTLDRDATLTPSDILVITPDINRYAPAVKAVFDQGIPPDVKLPYNIADRSQLAEAPLLKTFSQLLTLADGPLTLSSIMELLGQPLLLQRFKFPEPEQLLPVLQKAGIRWGLDEKRRAGNQPWAAGSWQQGIKALLIGYLVNDETMTWQNSAPVHHISGQQHTLLGNLYRFFQALQQLSNSVKKEKSWQQWKEQCQDWIGRFFCAEDQIIKIEDGAASLVQLRDWLECFFAQTALSGMQRKIPFSVFKEAILTQLTLEISKQPFLNGGITMGQMVPMRAIPFKVICIMGLNSGSFPRQNNPQAFDLMANNPRVGDRNKQSEDRFLFLETLMAVKQKFYCSFIGRSRRDNSPKLPSNILSEFLNDCRVWLRDEHGGVFSEKGLWQRLVVEHAIQPFSEKAQKQDVINNYHPLWLAPVRDIKSNLKDDQLKLLQPPSQVLLKDVITFFNHPLKAWLRDRLGLYMESQSHLTQDEEVFVVDGLQQWELINACIKQHDHDRAIEVLKRAEYFGSLPYGLSGEKAKNQIQESAALLIQKADEYAISDCRAEYFSSSVYIAGKYVEVGGELLVNDSYSMLLSASKLKGKVILSLWLSHLLMAADGSGRSSVVIARNDKNKVEALCLAPVDKELAKKELSLLLELWWEGQQVPLMMMPNSGWLLVNKGDKKAREQLLGSFKKVGETDDAYHRYMELNYEQDWNIFCSQAERVFKPLKLCIESALLEVAQ